MAQFGDPSPVDPVSMHVKTNSNAPAVLRTPQGLTPERDLPMQLHYTPSLEYLAGYFDGEGCITMRMRPLRKTYRLDVHIHSAYLPILKHLQDRFGGSLHRELQFVSKPMHIWTLSDIPGCCAFLKSIQPYAIEKRKQIDVAVIWLEHRLTFPLRGPHASFNPEIAQRVYEALKELKQEQH
jgi:hypothetical protein